MTERARPALALLSSVVAVATLLARCSGTGCPSGVREGDPCSQSQVGLTCPHPDAGACQSLVLLCDGTQFGTFGNSVGDSCTKAGLTCSGPDVGGKCPGYSLVCDGTQLVAQENVGPGAPCSQAGLVCPWPNTECDTCTCDGTSFQCKENCCTVGCGEAGTSDATSGD